MIYSMQETDRVCIVGTGAFARGLASVAVRTGTCHSHRLCMASRNGASARLPGLETVPVLTLYEAVDRSDMIIMAVPCSAYPALFNDMRFVYMLYGKVIVDVSNPRKADVDALPRGGWNGVAVEPIVEEDDGRCDRIGMMMTLAAVTPSHHASAAEWIHAKVTPFGGHVVKAFSNLSAHTLRHWDIHAEHMMSTVFASDDPLASRIVRQFAMAMGIDGRYVPTIRYARVIEGWQRYRMFDWHVPSFIMLLTWLVAYVCTTVRCNVYDGVPWRHNVMYVCNKSLAWTAVGGMTCCLVPYAMLPLWWEPCRRRLAVLSAGFLTLHALYSLVLLSPVYFPAYYDTNGDGKLTWYGEASIVCACLAMVAAGSVHLRRSIDWNVQWVSFVLAAAHVLFRFVAA